MKTQILFVCLGNICRSPSAEAVMKNLVANSGREQLYFIDSAGTAAYHAGEPADKRMRQHAARRGLNLTSLARAVEPEDLDKFDYIIAMDDSNYDNLLQITSCKEHEQKIHKMVDFASNRYYAEVPDPYYGGQQGFETVLDILDDACRGLLKSIQQDA